MSGVSLADLGLTPIEDGETLPQEGRAESDVNTWVTLAEWSGRGSMIGLDRLVPEGHDVAERVLAAVRDAISTRWPVEHPVHVMLAASPVQEERAEVQIRRITEVLRVAPIDARMVSMFAAASISLRQDHKARRLR